MRGTAVPEDPPPSFLTLTPPTALHGQLTGLSNSHTGETGSSVQSPGEHVGDRQQKNLTQCRWLWWVRGGGRALFGANSSQNGNNRESMILDVISCRMSLSKVEALNN